MKSSKFKQLLTDIENYKKAESIRKYINAKKKKALNKHNLSEEFTEYLKWAKSIADWLDPLLEN